MMGPMKSMSHLSKGSQTRERWRGELIRLVGWLGPTMLASVASLKVLNNIFEKIWKKPPPFQRGRSTRV